MGDSFVEERDPTAVFSAIADETRLGIIQALWEAEDESVPFSTLREAVGMADSGQFNYHLSKLVGPFVTQTEEGYSLTEAGKRVNGALASGTYTMETAVSPISLPEPCRACGGAKTFTYEDEAIRIECADCPVTWGAGVPPAVFEGYDREAFPRVASDYLRSCFHHLASGFCWLCHGPVEATVHPAPEMESADLASENLPATFRGDPGDIPMVDLPCRRCGSTASMTLEYLFLDHPAVASFYHDNGVDLRDELVWNVPHRSLDNMSIEREGPLRARVTYRADGASLALVVDEHLDVVDIRE